MDALFNKATPAGAAASLNNDRGPIAALIVVGHVLALFAVLVQPVNAARREQPTPMLLTYSVPQAAVARAPERPVVTLPAGDAIIAETPVQPEEILIAVPGAGQPAFVAGDPDCAPAAALQSALSADSDFKTALAAIPASQRSVADAIVVWNATWAPLAGDGDPALAKVKDKVIRTLRELPTTCLAQIVSGPRLVLVETSGGAMVLAFGSGSWRWQDVAGA